MTIVPSHRQTIGAAGESLAVAYLVKNEYVILERNFKARYGEIDIIATHHHVTVFVEVKTRLNTRYGTPQESVTPRKLHEVIKTAHYYMALHPNLPDALRIDVIAILLDPDSLTARSLEHIPNVTL